MIQKYINTVNKQLTFFDSKIKKHPTDTATQAKFWALKYEFEQLLNFLKDTQSSNIYTTELNLKASTQSKPQPINSNYGLRPQTTDKENKIASIIKDCP